LVLLVSFSFCSPLNPQWPPMYSTLIDLIEVVNGTTEVFTGTWYWDITKKSDRFDWVRVSTQISENIFNDYSKGISYLYIFDKKNPSIINCTYSSIDKEMPKHDFSDFKYVKDEIERGINIHVWTYKNLSINAIYYSQVDDSFPVRLETRKDKDKVIINFFDYTTGEQDADLFNRTKIYPKVTCKPELEKKDILKVSPKYLTSQQCTQVAQCAQHAVSSCGCKPTESHNICCNDHSIMSTPSFINECFKQNGLDIGIGIESQYHCGHDCSNKCVHSRLTECFEADLFFYHEDSQKDTDNHDRNALYLGNKNIAECHPKESICGTKNVKSDKFECRRYC